MSVFDISEFNPDNRVQELVDTDRADGIILKVGETISGVPEIDPKFIKFVNDVVSHGLPYGIYYVSHALNMDKFMQEAQWINDRVAEYLNGTEPGLGTWWDMEVGNVKRNDVWPQLRDSIGTMQSWWNNSKKIGIYAGYSYIKQYLDLRELANYQIPLWPAQYYKENSLKLEHPELKHVGWQFTDGNGNQDESKWYGFE